VKTYLEVIEIQYLEQVACNLRDRLLIRLLFHLGCRVTEAIALTTADIDFQRGVVSIRHLKMRLRLSCPQCGAALGKSHSFCPKCGFKVDQAVARELEHRRQRTLPIDALTLAILREYIDRGSPVLRDGKRFIFGINRHRAWQIIKECAERAGLPKLTNPETGKVHNVSPHRLRDSFAVNAIKHDDSGDGLRLLQEHLGHQSIATTMRYRKISGEEHRDWYEKLWNNKGGK
jgi:integrase/recombinase XerD